MAPLWLFWTRPESVSLQCLCLMYLWRFAIEHMFRFVKQCLGLNANQSTNLISIDQWMWLCALAYWQLLLIRDEVEDVRPAWFPAKTTSGKTTTIPKQVQRRALRYLSQLGTPALSVRPTGKGLGHPKGFCPPPRKRFPVVKKSKTRPKKAVSGI